jgi:hypothetical protein
MSIVHLPPYPSNRLTKYSEIVLGYDIMKDAPVKGGRDVVQNAGMWSLTSDTPTVMNEMHCSTQGMASD